MPSSIIRLLKYQAAVTFLLPCLVLLPFDMSMALSVGVGAAINFVAQLVFARFAFRHRGARSAALIAQAFARGESLKMVLIAGLLAVVLSQIKSIHPLGMLFGLLAVQSVFWFFPFIDRRRESTALRD
ncbi:MAG: ATP synthase subunit I [Granulosicoccaceae bacterium]